MNHPITVMRELLLYSEPGRRITQHNIDIQDRAADDNSIVLKFAICCIADGIHVLYLDENMELGATEMTVKLYSSRQDAAAAMAESPLFPTLRIVIIENPFYGLPK